MLYIEDLDIVEAPAPTTLLEVRIGKVQNLDAPVLITSAINKTPRQERVFLTKTGLVEDCTVYEFHGGMDKALHQYDMSHYKSWGKERPDLAHLFRQGGYGENLVTMGMNERNVCIGDRYSIGSEVVVEISEPRQPCFKLNHRFKWKRASLKTQQTGRTGWYLRVIQTGYIQHGDKMELISRPHPKWSIARVQEILYRDMGNIDAMKELIQLTQLGQYLRDVFRKRLLDGPEDQDSRLKGKANDLVWRPYKLVVREDLTPRIKRFVLELAQEIELKDVDLGPFSHVRVKFGDYTRAYSVVKGDLRRFELGIAKDDNSRGGSRYLCDELQTGDIIEVVKGFTNAPERTNEITKHVFIIVGIGITAFVQQIQKLKEEGQMCEVHYAVRSVKDAAYLDVLKSCYDAQTIVYAKDQNQRLDSKALITSLATSARNSTVIYTCGPSSLITAVQQTAFEANHPSSHLHFEDFGGTSTKEGPSFSAKLKSTGKVIQVPSKKSLLDVLREVGMDVPSSCEVGNCGVCIVDYCGGKVVHKGVALMEEDKKESLLSCVSRGKSGECVVLDL